MIAPDPTTPRLATSSPPVTSGQMEKTEKSMAELEIERNLAHEFNLITEAGAALQPLSGPGCVQCSACSVQSVLCLPAWQRSRRAMQPSCCWRLASLCVCRYVGLKNLGNSCYMNSVLQVHLVLALHFTVCIFLCCAAPYCGTSAQLKALMHALRRCGWAARRCCGRCPRCSSGTPQPPRRCTARRRGTPPTTFLCSLPRWGRRWSVDVPAHRHPWRTPWTTRRRR